MRTLSAKPLRIADVFACSVTIAPPKFKHSSAGFEVFAARTSQKSEATRSYYETLVFHDLSSREHRSKVYEDKALKVGVAQFGKYGLQVQVQGKQFKRTIKRLGNKKALCVVPAPLFVCVSTNESHYVKEDKEYKQ